MAELRKQNIQSIANYAVEGLMTHDEERIVDFYEQTLATIEAQAALDHEGHAALKLTGLMSLDEMTRISSAQDTFLYGVLALDELRRQDTRLSFGQFSKNLESRGIDLTQEESSELFASLKFQDGNDLSRLEVYAGGHLFKLFGEDNKVVASALRKVALATGVTENDL